MHYLFLSVEPKEIRCSLKVYLHTVSCFVYIAPTGGGYFDDDGAKGEECSFLSLLGFCLQVQVYKND